MAVNPEQSRSLLGAAPNVTPNEGVQVAQLGPFIKSIVGPAASKVAQRVAPHLDKAGRKIGPVVDVTSGNTMERARVKAKQLKQERAAAPEVNTVDQPASNPLETQAADQQPTDPIPTEANTPKDPQEVDLNENPIDNVVDPRRQILEEPDPNDRWIRITDDDGRDLINAPKDRDALLEGGMTDFNSEKMIDENGIIERVEAVSQKYAGKIDADKRGVITLQATRQMADLIGANEKRVEEIAKALLERKRGQGIQVEGMGMAEVMLAAKDLLMAEVRKLDKLASDAEVGGPEQLASFLYQQEFVANLQRQYKGAQTEYARTLSAMRIPPRGEITGDVVIDTNAERMRGRDLTKLLDEYGGIEAVRLRAKLHNELPDVSKKLQNARGLTFWKRLANAGYEVWHHALLTNPITQTKNLLGGVINTFALSNLELGLAAGIGGVRRAMGAARVDTATLSDLNAQLFGQVMSLMEASSASGKAFLTMTDEIGGSKLDHQQMVQPFSGRGLGFDPATQPVLSNAADVLGNILTGGRISYRTLQAGDTFFKVIAARGELYKQAMISADARGLSGDAKVDYIAEFIADPPAVALDKVEAVAKYQTLQSDMDKYGKAIQTLGRAPVLRYFLPFLKTPYNAAKYTFVDRSPLGIWWGNTGAMWRAGGKQKDEAIARMSLGTGIGMVAFNYALSGNITGGGPADPKAKEALRLKGWQPYSIKLGDTYYSYAGVEPLSSILGVWADAATIAVADGARDTKYTDVIGAALGATIYNVSNKTFMQGFANLGRAIADPKVYGVKSVEDLIQSAVPRVFSYAERLNDPLLNDAKGFIENVKKQIPGLSADLQPRVDLLGNDIYLGVLQEDMQRDLAFGYDVISPFYKSKEKNSPVIEAINAAKGLGTENFDRNIKIKGLIKPIQLPDALRHELQVSAGKLGEKTIAEVIKEPEIKRLIKMSQAGNKDAQQLLQFELTKVYIRAKNAALMQIIETSKPFQDFLELRRNIEADERREIEQGILGEE